MPRANRYFLPGYVTARISLSRSKWFDGLTMTGFILNRFAEPALSSAEGVKA
jgi:hypothetical protein